MRNFKIIFFAILLGVFFAGCTASKSSKSDAALAGESNPAKYSNAYLERVAGESIADLLSKRIIKKKGGRFSIVGIEPLQGIENSGVDTAFLSKKIRISLLHSGKAVVTGAPQKNEPVFSNEGISRAEHAVGTGSIYAPDYILVGKISSSAQRKLAVKSKKDPVKTGEKALTQADESLFLELFLIDTQSKKSVWKYKRELQKQI